MENYVGKRLDGRYEIRDVVGVGGMAVVYKAYDNIDDRIVAVKILKDEYLTNEEFRRRFKNESKAIAVLSHRNIVKVFDVSFGDRLQYIVMEYIEGITLKEYIEQKGVLDWREALFFSIQILRALQHAHDKGIVHRDVKPQNIMLLSDGTIKVTDFGIARFSHSETRTMTEKAIGSVHYISPEQAKGEITDEKADLYSIGVVFYEMLTGKLPFDADSAVSVALMQVNNEAAMPRTINPNIPLGFEQITMKAMQKNTRERYQSASEILMDLEELKRNPNVKFDYQKYYVAGSASGMGVASADNNAATRVLNIAEQDEVLRTVPPAADVRNRFENNRRKKPEKKSGKNPKVIAVAAGVGVALLIAIILFVVNLFTSDDFFLNFGSKKVEVPKFVGMNYEKEIKDNEDYSMFKFETEYVLSSDASPGTVISQDPEPGKKVNKNKVILLTIATNGEMVTIPGGFIGQDYNPVCQTLRDLDLIPKATPQVDDTKEPGEVIKVDPGAGSVVSKRSDVIVYYAISSDDDNFFDMPNLVGKDLEEVKDILSSYGLQLGAEETVDDPAPKNEVIGQSVPANTPVRKGEVIDIVISSGKMILEKTIDLPKGIGALSVEVIVDGKVAITEMVDTSSVSKYTFKVGGEDKNTSIQVYLNGALYYEATGDFTKSDVKLSNENIYDICFYVDVVGMSQSDALTILNNAGYKEINIKYDDDTTEAPGTVINQSPGFSTAPHLGTDAVVVLTIAASKTVDEPTDDTVGDADGDIEG